MTPRGAGLSGLTDLETNYLGADRFSSFGGLEDLHHVKGRNSESLRRMDRHGSASASATAAAASG